MVGEEHRHQRHEQHHRGFREVPGGEHQAAGGGEPIASGPAVIPAGHPQQKREQGHVEQYLRGLDQEFGGHALDEDLRRNERVQCRNQDEPEKQTQRQEAAAEGRRFADGGIVEKPEQGGCEDDRDGRRPSLDKIAEKELGKGQRRGPSGGIAPRSDIHRIQPYPVGEELQLGPEKPGAEFIPVERHVRGATPDRQRRQNQNGQPQEGCEAGCGHSGNPVRGRPREITGPPGQAGHGHGHEDPGRCSQAQP